MSQMQTHDYKKPNDAKDGSQKQGEWGGDVKESLSGMARDAESTAKAGAQELSKGVKQAVDAGKKGAAEAIDGLTGCISDRPLTRIGIALGVGLLVGMVFRRSVA